MVVALQLANSKTTVERINEDVPEMNSLTKPEKSKRCKILL